MLKQLNVLKDNELIDNKLYHYRKPTDSPAPKLYGQPKIHMLGVPIHPIVHTVAPHCTILTFLKLMLKMKITTPKFLPRIRNIQLHQKYSHEYCTQTFL